ncbi:MAG: gamma-glutamyl-gamma-aminobutyrate hydrolase family protein [Micrococcales bacterium]|nr:gamma-glutamyl-gamma-aminobutyrate hydrolase family protein [Micrococcales bacterium]
MGLSVLVVDNYDSFVWTLVGYLHELGASTRVVRNDMLDDVAASVDHADGVLVSPGPGAPGDAGVCGEVVTACAATRTAMLGVCLGHQVLAETFGATVTHAPVLMHGKTSQVTHDGTSVLAGLTSPFTATRYHSLAVVPSTVPDGLRVTAWADQTIMGLAHRTLPLHGVQFHPESVLTEGGHRIMANWLALCGGEDNEDNGDGSSVFTT